MIEQVHPMDQEKVKSSFLFGLKKLGFSKLHKYLSDYYDGKETARSYEQFRELFWEYQREDFLTNTDGNIESYSIAIAGFRNYYEGMVRKKPNKRRPPLVIPKERIMDSNVKRIITAYETQILKAKENREIRFHIMLLAYVVMSDIAHSIVDKYFEEFYSYGAGLPKKNRKELVNRYFIDTQGIPVDGDRMDEFRFIRNQIAHSLHEIYENNAKIYFDDSMKVAIDKPFEYYHELYNHTIVKVGFLKQLLYSKILLYHISQTF